MYVYLLYLPMILQTGKCKGSKYNDVLYCKEYGLIHFPPKFNTNPTAVLPHIPLT